MIAAAPRLSRRAPRLEAQSAARSAPVAEFVGEAGLDAAAWRRLCARALEPNPFAEPGFLLPLLGYQKPRRLRLAVVRNGGRWIGFVALIVPRAGLARVWMSAYAALPALALDREAAAAAVAAVLDLLRRETRVCGIVWPLVERGGAFAEVLSEAGELRLAGSRRRTACRLSGAADFDAGLDPRRRTKWARKARKLRGKLEARTGPEEIEAFLDVEPRGWKGERRSALADDPSRAAFARAALESFARDGRLDAMTLRLDGTPIAAGLVLMAGGRAFYWKTAYDEAYGEASPGIQLTLAHTRRLADTPGLTLVDSCAAEDHPMIGRVWGDALSFEDWTVALRPGVTLWLALARAKARARETLKRWAKSALGGKRS